MKKLTLFVLLLPLLTIAQETGIHFEHGLSWAQIKAKAKAENKFIFMDCYTTWCGPCKMMSNDIFPLENVGNLMNEKFISVKVQIDMFYGDNEEVRSWYSDAHNISQKYNVIAYPTYLFFDPNAELVHRFAGAYSGSLFLIKVKQALDPDTQYYTLLKKYKAGQRDMGFTRKIAYASVQAYEKEEAQKILADFMRTFKDSIYTLTNLQFLNSITTRASDKGFQIIFEHADKVNAIMGKNAAEEQVAHIVIQEALLKLKTERYNNNLNWVTMASFIRQNYRDLSLKTVAIIKIKCYENSKDWNNYQNAVAYFINEFSPDISSKQLNEYARNIFLHSNDTAHLQDALGWSDKCCKNKDTTGFPNLALYFDTYANLLYKLGQKEEALLWEQKAINLATKFKQKIYRQIFDKMKSGQRTWEL